LVITSFTRISVNGGLMLKFSALSYHPLNPSDAATATSQASHTAMLKLLFRKAQPDPVEAQELFESNMALRVRMDKIVCVSKSNDGLTRKFTQARKPIAA
jgi:hypothetical protein